LTWDQLAKRAPKSAPLLVHYDRPQKHFALVLDVEAERVITADPARGIEVLSREEFEARWSGVALFVTHPSATLNRKRLDEARSSSLARADLLDTRARSP
jgi:ABC-type bacteriocin/lantibiotic exporter with double-glycine peptidase domain